MLKQPYFLKHGFLQCQFTFGKTNVSQTVLVADIPTEVLLGMDFLKENKCELDLARNIMHLKNEKIDCWDENEENANFRIISSADFLLEPHETRNIIAQVLTTGNITK